MIEYLLTVLSKCSTFSLELMNGTLGTSDIRVGRDEFEVEFSSLSEPEL